MKALKDQSVWITGASTGIGKELALLAARAGSALVLISSNEETLAETVHSCRRQGAQSVHSMPTDLSDIALTVGTVKKLLAEHGAPNFLILNAGKSQRSLTGETDIAVMQKIMNINFFSAAIIGSTALEAMSQLNEAHIAVTSSVVGCFGFPLRSSYSASKHALHGFFETLGLEYHSRGIRVTLVVLGRVKTGISVNALDGKGGHHGVMDAGQNKGMAPHICARKYWRAVLRERPLAVMGGIETLMLRIHSYFPWMFRAIVYKINPL